MEKIKIANHFKYKKTGGKRKKKKSELKIFSGDIHFPVEMDKIFRHRES